MVTVLLTLILALLLWLSGTNPALAGAIVVFFFGMRNDL
jgi:hypothetical protein